MLQQDEPEDFVIATGKAHSVRQCVEIAFDQAGLEVDDHVEIDPDLQRPAEVDHLHRRLRQSQARCSAGSHTRASRS